MVIWVLHGMMLLTGRVAWSDVVRFEGLSLRPLEIGDIAQKTAASPLFDCLLLKRLPMNESSLLE